MIVHQAENKPMIFTRTSLVTGYSTVLRRDMWTGMAGWSQWVSSIGPVDLARCTPSSSSFTAMTATSMIGPEILCNPTTSSHISSRQATPPMTSQMIMGPTACWRDITAYQEINGRDSMEPWYLLLPAGILFLCRCGAYFNNNQPVSSLMPLKKLLPLAPPNQDTNTQACLAATQTPSGTKS